MIRKTDSKINHLDSALVFSQPQIPLKKEKAAALRLFHKAV